MLVRVKICAETDDSDEMRPDEVWLLKNKNAVTHMSGKGEVGPFVFLLPWTGLRKPAIRCRRKILREVFGI